MDRTLLFQLVLAAAVVVVGATVFATALGRLSRGALVGLASLLGGAALTAWLVLVFDSSAELAIAAAGLTACAAIEGGTVLLRAALARSRRVDSQLAAAEARLRLVIELEAEERAAEVERTLARARAESVSRLLDQERKIAEAHREDAVARERQAGVELGKALAATQKRVERRLAEWTEDIERVQQAFAAEVGRLGEQQRQLIAEAETRIAANADRLETETEEQRAALVELRQQIARAAHDAVAAGTAEMETAGLERRRALQELADQLRRREQSLNAQIDREESEAVRRIQAGLTDVERRQVESLERAVGRASASFSEAAALQFADDIKAAREDAAQRLARELDRSVQAFAREAATVLAEKLAQVGDAGAQRLEKRLSGVTAGLERQREEFVEGFERRLVEAESELRRRLELLVRDTESERAVLKARLDDLARQIDELVSGTRERLVELGSLRAR